MPTITEADAYDTTTMQAPEGAVWRNADGTFASSLTEAPEWAHTPHLTSPTVNSVPPTLHGTIATFGA